MATTRPAAPVGWWRADRTRRRAWWALVALGAVVGILAWLTPDATTDVPVRPDLPTQDSGTVAGARTTVQATVVVERDTCVTLDLGDEPVWTVWPAGTMLGPYLDTVVRGGVEVGDGDVVTATLLRIDAADLPPGEPVTGWLESIAAACRSTGRDLVVVDDVRPAG